ncbi:hypothetical protein [Ramlibacter sp. PS4R-6]|uniref:hypothetical protein n=1 Tax=Ramlibacter sp. PS4R-6 TaxID=3133438 RepID=UPI0030AE3C91
MFDTDAQVRPRMRSTFLSACIQRTIAALLLPILLLAGCDQDAMFEKLVPAEEAAAAKDVVAKLAARDFASIEPRLGPNLRNADARAKLEQMAGLIPAEKPKSVRTVGANTMRANSVTTYNLTFEYEYQGGWLLVATLLERRDGKLTLEGLHLVPNRQSLAVANAFTFEGKGPLHYVVFALAIAIPLFVIYALVACARAKIPRRKWLWLLFVAIGFVQFTFNWTTGAWDVHPVAFALLGAAFAKAGPVAPWIFTLAFPLGAVLFFLIRPGFQGEQPAPAKAAGTEGESLR